MDNNEKKYNYALALYAIIGCATNQRIMEDVTPLYNENRVEAVLAYQNNLYYNQLFLHIVPLMKETYPRLLP